MIKIIDLFAGIGGIRLGFENVSTDTIQCVFTSEWDKHAAETYRTNFPGEIVYGDITKIDENKIPDHDILLAGFPCQPFSQAGLKMGFADTRGTLFFDIERILIAKQPGAFLLENVKQLKGHDSGRTLKTILEHLVQIGYRNINVGILKARDFGLPQNRERIYIAGFRDDKIKFSFPQPLNIKTRLGDILEKKVNDKFTISDKMWIGHQKRKERNKLNGKGFGYSLFNHDSEYANTISARYWKDGSEILIAQKGKNPRTLTPREAARLQGFPEEFIIHPSKKQAYRQFGNSVPVNVIEAIAFEMLKAAGLIKKQKKIKSKSVAEPVC